MSVIVGDVTARFWKLMKRQQIEDAATAEFHCTIKAAVMTRAARGHGAHGAWAWLGRSLAQAPAQEQSKEQGREGGRVEERKKEMGQKNGLRPRK